MTVRSSYLDDARENGTRQAVSRGLLLTAGGGSAGGTTTGTLVRFIDLDVGVAVTTSAERAEVIVHGETVWIPADPGAYVLGGPVVVMVDGTGRPVRVTGPAGTVPAPVEGAPSPVVVHRPELVLDEGARQRNAQVAAALDDAVEDLGTLRDQTIPNAVSGIAAVGDLLEELRSRTGLRQWVGPESFTVDDFTDGLPFLRAEPLGNGRVRFTATRPGPHTGWRVGGVLTGDTGAQMIRDFTSSGAYWVLVVSGGVQYQAQVSVTSAMMAPVESMWEDIELPEIDWSDAEVALDQLTVPGGPLDPETLVDGWVPVLAAAFAVVSEGIIAGNAIIEDTLTAAHIIASEELSAKIANFLEVTAGMLNVTTGDPGDARLSILEDGIRMWRAGNNGPSPNVMMTTGEGFRFCADDGTTVAWLDPVEGLVLGDQAGGGAQVSRRGLQVIGPDEDSAVQLGDFDRLGMTLYRDGEARAYVGDDGEVGGEVVSASESFLYRGDELSTILEERSARVLTRFSFAGNQFATIPGSGGYLDVVEVQYDMQAGHLYRIAARPINVLLGSASGDPAVSASLYWTKDGSRPTRASERINLDHRTPGTGPSQRVTFNCERLAHGTGATRVLLSLSAASRSLQILDVASLYVEDLGPDPGVNDGTLRNFVRANEGDTAPPTAPPKTARKPLELSASWVKSWQENGDSPGAIAGRAYQGRTPHYSTAGRYRSMVGFPSMTTTLNGADIDKIEVRVKPAHGGGTGGNMTVRLGTHGATSAPGSFASAATDLASRTIKAGRAEWLTLPSSTHAGFKDGTLRGVVLHTTSVSAAEYGYALPSGIDIRIHYRK